MSNRAAKTENAEYPLKCALPLHFPEVKNLSFLQIALEGDMMNGVINTRSDTVLNHPDTGKLGNLHRITYFSYPVTLCERCRKYGVLIY